MPDTRGVNFYEIDDDLKRLLRATLTAAEFAQAEPHLHELGSLVGGRLDELSRSSDRHPPELRGTDQRGVLINAVDAHPDTVELTRIGVEQFALVAMSHRPVLGFSAPLSHTLKYAFWYLFVQGEFSLACPMSMTDAAVRVLRRYASQELNDAYVAPMLRTDAGYQSGAQFMTEKQGGSDVGANLLRAEPVENGWRLWGDKWFCSNVSADVALVLARPDGAAPGTAGLAMFLMPRVLPDGSMNHFRVTRLKDKLGTRGLASGEIVFEGAVGYPVGALDDGFRQMMSMVNASRLSNAVRSSALMRRSLVEATTAANGRDAFGGPLAEKPLMRDTLFRMLVETEAAAVMVFHTAGIYERADAAVAEAAAHSELPSTASVPPDADSRLLRLLTPLVKGVVCKRARQVVAEGMEARGGNGYIDEWVDGKLLRDAQLGSIWEGTTSIVALDVQRALLRNRAGAPFFTDIRARLDRVSAHPELGALSSALSTWARELEEAVSELPELPEQSRELGAITLMNRMYDLCAASLLLAQAEAQIRDSRDYRKVAVLLGFLGVHRPALSPPGAEPSSVLLGGAALEILGSGHVSLAAVRPSLEGIRPESARPGTPERAAGPQ
ncbi:acyl-CoA dehydrogenase family protein [Leucobacter sp. M11]|nr:acyl-CoA dehydrogenase family protein [Leucobacter sp. M11]